MSKSGVISRYCDVCRLVRLTDQSFCPVCAFAYDDDQGLTMEFRRNEFLKRLVKLSSIESDWNANFTRAVVKPDPLQLDIDSHNHILALYHMRVECGDPAFEGVKLLYESLVWRYGSLPFPQGRD